MFFFFFFFFFGVAAAAAAGECATTKNGEEMVRLTASSTSETIASVLKEYGAVIVETLSEEPLMEILAHELGNASGIFFGSKDSFAGEQTSRNAAKPLGESAIARSLATNEKIVSVAETVETLSQENHPRHLLGYHGLASPERPRAGATAGAP